MKIIKNKGNEDNVTTKTSKLLLFIKIKNEQKKSKNSTHKKLKSLNNIYKKSTKQEDIEIPLPIHIYFLLKYLYSHTLPSPLSPMAWVTLLYSRSHIAFFYRWQKRRIPF